MSMKIRWQDRMREKIGFNGDYLRSLIASSSIDSQNRAEDKLGWSRGKFSMLTRNEQSIKPAELYAIAELFGRPVEEVFEANGFPIRKATKGYPVAGTVNGVGAATVQWEAGQGEELGPGDMGDHAFALRFDTRRSSLEPYHGWVAFVREPSQQTLLGAMGRLCLVGVGDDALLRFVRQGDVPGTFGLIPFPAGEAASAHITWATPVLWLKPP